jgi:hypothetical protein
MPLTAPVERLRGTLASWADPRSVAPLGHLVDPDGPCGRVEGLVRPVGGPISWSAGGDLSLRPPAPTGRPTVQRLRLPASDPIGAVADDATSAPVQATPLLAVGPAWSVPVAPTDSAGAGRAPLVHAAPVSQPSPERPVVAPSVQRQAAPEELTKPVHPDPTAVHAADAGPALVQAGEDEPAVADLVGDRPTGTASVPDPDDRSAGSATSGAGQPPVQRAEAQRLAFPAGPGGSAGSSGPVSRTHEPPVVQRTESAQPASAAAGRRRRSRIGAPLEGPLEVQRLTVATERGTTPWFPDASASMPGPAPQASPAGTPSVQRSELPAERPPVAPADLGAGTAFSPSVADVAPVGAPTSLAPLTSEVTVTGPSVDGPDPPPRGVPVQRGTDGQSSSSTPPVPRLPTAPSHPGPGPAAQGKTPTAGLPVQRAAARPAVEADVRGGQDPPQVAALDSPAPGAPLTSAVPLMPSPLDDPVPPMASPSPSVPPSPVPVPVPHAPPAAVPAVQRTALSPTGPSDVADGGPAGRSAVDGPVLEAPLTSAVSLTPPLAPAPPVAPPPSSLPVPGPHAAPPAVGPAVQRTAVVPTAAPDLARRLPDPAGGTAADGPVLGVSLTSAVSLAPSSVVDSAEPAAASAPVQRTTAGQPLPASPEPLLVAGPSAVQRAVLPLTTPPAAGGREPGGPAATGGPVPPSGSAPDVVQRSLEPSPSAPASASPAASAPPVQAMAPAGEPPAVPLPLAPLLGSAPPMGSLAGSTLAGSAAGSAPAPGPGVPVATLQRSVDGVTATAGSPGTRQPASAKAGAPVSSGSGGTSAAPVVQLSPAVGPAGSGGADVGSPRGLHPQSVQTLALGSAPVPPPGAAAEQWAGPGAHGGLDPGAGLIAAGVASRSADGSLVFAQPGAADGASGGSPVSPAVPPAPVDVGAPASGAAATGNAPAATTSGPSSAGSTTDLEELARRLFEPLSARLRSELRLERERAGVLTDLRH